MRRQLLDHWLDNLDSLFKTYATVAKAGGTWLEQAQRNRNDALRLFFEFGSRQLGQFWSWYYPGLPAPPMASARRGDGVALAIGLDADTLAKLRDLLVHRRQRLVIVEPGKNPCPGYVDFDADPLRCDISCYQACDTLITGLEENIGPVELLIKQSSIKPDPGLRAPGVLDGELDCLYNLTRHLIPAMIKRRHGRIIILKPEQPADQQPLLQHAGITGFIRSLSAELSQSGITVECMPVTRLDDIVRDGMALDPRAAHPSSDSQDLPSRTVTA